jgi:hypothetical protein
MNLSNTVIIVNFITNSRNACSIHNKEHITLHISTPVYITGLLLQRDKL